MVVAVGIIYTRAPSSHVPGHFHECSRVYGKQARARACTRAYITCSYKRTTCVLSVCIHAYTGICISLEHTHKLHTLSLPYALHGRNERVCNVTYTCLLYYVYARLVYYILFCVGKALLLSVVCVYVCVCMFILSIGYRTFLRHRGPGSRSVRACASSQSPLPCVYVRAPVRKDRFCACTSSSTSLFGRSAFLMGSYTICI